MAAPGTPYTEAELHRAIKLRAAGHSWATVAAILGRTRGSLKVTVCRWRKGVYRTTAERAEVHRQVDNLLVHAVKSEGITATKVLSHRAGLSLTQTNVRLSRLGLNAGTRRTLARAAQTPKPPSAERRGAGTPLLIAAE